MDASTFPIAFPLHLGFCVIAGIFFLLQFIRLHRPYQLMMAVAIPASLLIYVNESKSWFHTVGIFEAVLLLGAIVLAFLYRNREQRVTTENQAPAAAESTSEEQPAE